MTGNCPDRYSLHGTGKGLNTSYYYFFIELQGMFDSRYNETKDPGILFGGFLELFFVLFTSDTCVNGTVPIHEHDGIARIPPARVAKPDRSSRPDGVHDLSILENGDHAPAL